LDRIPDKVFHARLRIAEARGDFAGMLKYRWSLCVDVTCAQWKSRHQTACGSANENAVQYSLNGICSEGVFPGSSDALFTR
jgi:hypothetical protein